MKNSLRMALAGLCTGFLLLSMHGTAMAQGYTQSNLVSNLPGEAAWTDASLVNPWGVSFSPTGPFWVSDNGTGVSTLYTSNGTPIPLVVKIPMPAGKTGTAAPTGQVFNGTQGFQVGPMQPALFIFVTEDGTISGWNPAANRTNAILKVDHSSQGAVYKGCALDMIGQNTYLYVTNFSKGRVEVYNSQFQRVRGNDDSDSRLLAEDAFRDERIPERYAPFNIQSVGKYLAVTFAQRDRTGSNEVDGPGRGYVDLFTTRGRLVMRLQHGSFMNAPWGIAMAPAGFGPAAGDLLVGNFGSGWIGEFSPATGMFMGFLSDTHGAWITIPGIWAIAFGNGGAAGSVNSLYFAAGINGENAGLLGSLSYSAGP